MDETIKYLQETGITAEDIHRLFIESTKQDQRKQERRLLQSRRRTD